MLDDVFATNDPALQILARHAQAELLTSLVTRMLATVPPPANDTAAAVNLRELRLQMVRLMIDPWQTRAQNAYAEIDRIARSHPELAKNPAVVAAVRRARQVAKR
jgi:hypothetical protein